ncbi:MAG TPA: type II toxin-antitoxin system mRNA interferase toxin, RelE/StbE family [Candidatus Paceibacterota bacterium]
MEINTLPRFDKHYKKLPKKLKETAKEKEKTFRSNPYHPSLRTHALHGQDKGLHAFWIDQKYRIKFLFITPQKVLFLDVGTHDIYE